MEFQARLHFIGLVERAVEGRAAVEAVAAAILKASQEHVGDAYGIVKDRIRADVTSQAERLSLIYVLDVVCSKLAQRNQPHALLDAVQEDLPELVAATAGMPTEPSESAREDGGNSAIPSSNLHALQRVVSRWKNEDVFSHGTLGDIERFLAAAAERRKALAPPAVTKTDMLRAIEAEREKQKRMREDAFLRPVDDPEDGEFDDLWGPDPRPTPPSPPAPTAPPAHAKLAAKEQPKEPATSKRTHDPEKPVEVSKEATSSKRSKLDSAPTAVDALPAPTPILATAARNGTAPAVPVVASAPAPAASLATTATSTPTPTPTTTATPTTADSDLSKAGRPKIRRPRLSDPVGTDPSPAPQHIPTPGPTPPPFMRPIDAGAAGERALTYTTALAPRRTGTHQAVIVWDLDETLIVFQGLARGYIGKTHVSSLRKDPAEATKLHNAVELTILHAADALNAAALDAENPPHISWATDDSTARLLQAVRSLYEGPSALASVLRGHGTVGEWEATYSALNALTDDWLTLATGILEGVDSSTVHVLVSSSHLLPLLIKCILFKLQPHFAVDHLYSSARFGKLWCMTQIRARFGPDASYVVVGDSEEERWAADEVKWPFVQWSSIGDLIQFYKQYAEATAAASPTK